MRLGYSSTFAIGGLLLLSVVHAQDARMLLDRMSQAVEELNYQGRFVHFVGDDVETLYVIHRNVDGEVGERIVALDGVGREIIRRGDNVQCILPDQKVILLEERPQLNPLDSLPGYSEALDANYKLKLYSEERLLDRRAQIVGIHSRDDYRYSYLLWLDTLTAMPLKIELWSDSETKLEEIRFTSIEFPATIADSALEATIDTTGFTRLQSPVAMPHGNEAVPWEFTGLPSGFSLSTWVNRPGADASSSVDHLVLKDGVATVSVFVEMEHAPGDDMADGFSSVGTTNAFSLTSNGRTITAVGEVPRRTLQGIATGISFK